MQNVTFLMRVFRIFRGVFPRRNVTGVKGSNEGLGAWNCCGHKGIVHVHLREDDGINAVEGRIAGKERRTEIMKTNTSSNNYAGIVSTKS